MNNSKKIIAIILISLITNSCKKHLNISEIKFASLNDISYTLIGQYLKYKSSNFNDQVNVEYIIRETRNEIVEKQIGWKIKYFKNFSFEVPDNFVKQSHLSNSNREVYQSKNTGSTFTIDIAQIPIGYENSTIKAIVSNLNEFGKNVNQQNKNLFSDFKLINTEYSNLGNIESILVRQISTKISGIINKSMVVNAHFILANPYYCTYTFSYPNSSSEEKQTLNRITSSFKFKNYHNKKIESVTSSNKSEPSLKESVDWLLSKLNNYVLMNEINYISYDEGKYMTVTKMSPFKIINGNLEINYRYQSYDPIINKIAYQNFVNAGFSNQYAMKQSNSGEYRLERDELFKIEIPFNYIDYNYYDKNKDYKGECSFAINTYKNDIIEYNLSKGTKRFISYYKFKYDCSKEDDLGNRINKAFEQIKKLTPIKNTNNKEPF